MKMTRFMALLLTLCAAAPALAQQLPPVFGTQYNDKVEFDTRVRTFVSPVSIVWKSDDSGKYIVNADNLLKAGNGQANFLDRPAYCVMSNKDGHKASILVDFGKELHGAIQLVSGQYAGKEKLARLRVSLGESVSEAMSSVEAPKTTATNDHALRDFEVIMPWFGKVEVGNSGFRFARIDLVDADRDFLLKEVRAVFIYRDIPYLGSFNSSDKRLNDIWMTGAYTTHLNMQNYLWDGIKRDRLVWIGDMHPEVMTISAVFGHNEVVPRSLDLMREVTPLPRYMNGISSYSMWWLLIHHEWYRFQGNLDYLKEQKPYMVGLLKQLAARIDDTGSEKLDGNRFLDWPTSRDKEAVHAGLQALMILTLDAGAEMCQALEDAETAALCAEAAARLRKNVPDPKGVKQPAALMVMAGLLPAAQANDQVLKVGGTKGYSPFYGYYILEAMAQAGDYQGALDAIREYWGAMLDLGATTFWEHFDIETLPNAARIDQFVPEGKYDVHADGGDFCYVGLRQSLCHGWASGPTAWLSEHVLGVKVLEPGCRKIKLEPHLGDLQWVEGSYPTPHGVLKIRHDKQADGTVKTTFTAPEGVTVVQ